MRTATLAVLAVIPLLAHPLRAQDTLPPVADADWPALRREVRGLLRDLDRLHVALPAATAKELREWLDRAPADPGQAALMVQKLLDPLCLVGVHINPESRVKAGRGPRPATLRWGEETVVLVKVHNEAGVTHRLDVAGPGVAVGGAGTGWLEARVAGGKLDGRKLEYRLLRLRPRLKDAGKNTVARREATLRFDVGQGTQDLGFRAEVPILFRVQPARGK